MASVAITVAAFGRVKLEQFAGVAGEIAVYLVEVCALCSFLFQLAKT